MKITNAVRRPSLRTRRGDLAAGSRGAVTLWRRCYNQKFDEAYHTADHLLRNHADLWKEFTVRECLSLRFGAEQLSILSSMGQTGTTALPLYIQTVTAS